MPEWTINRTETFLKYLKKHKNNNELLKELDTKINKLKVDPTIIGGFLSGKLQGKKSTRLAGKFRLIFSVDERNKTVFLIALDHRGIIY